ncbi:hypothetical protein FALBO_7967 [Fusarium albosuccineum]|uniref:N-acetyltransferase domain-containing protein n=1 Tax=Fusarium albosuccineum TaxID=1237068 RepID=A0A8H4PBZ9_9HYPO|nr:hypothetical protein FALBO_7967 [Fusarium albosuccineum]
MEAPPIEFVTVKTTLPKQPFAPGAERSPFWTQRLVMRPFAENDFETLRLLRSQPEVMTWFTQCRPDKDIEETKAIFALDMPPKDVERFNWVICLADSGEMIGVGGNTTQKGELGWPAAGYALLKEHWGKGYATEFMAGFLQAWWALPREEAELKVDKNTVRGDGGVEHECISAITVDDNMASQKVMRKSGLELATVWEEPDLRDLTQKVTLYGFVARKEKPVQ